MDNRIPDMRQIAVEPWMIPGNTQQDARTIPPVSESGGATFNKMSNDSGSQQGRTLPSMTPENAKQLASSAQSYLDDLNIGVKFQVDEKSGDVIVQVVNRDTNQVIRQIPPEALVKLHDHLRDLVGVIYTGKA
jgi:flagellar protein FlaG